MLYKEIIDYLSSVSAITDILSTYAGAPAIFQKKAPEKANMPYVTILIAGRKHVDSTINYGDLILDYWDFNKSQVKANEFDMELENALDSIRITGGVRLSDIRFDLSSSGHVEDSDSRDIHFNAIYGFRGIRKKWMEDTQ